MGSIDIEIRTRAGQHTARLEVSYDGLEPPVALWSDLAMIGWRPPAFTPPPAAAIDWATPDPTTGERFTVGPWRVEAQIVEPPRGSGPRGAWTADERAAYLLGLQGVLERHGVAERNALPPPPSAPVTQQHQPAAVTPAPAPSPTATGSVGIRAEGGSPAATVHVTELLDAVGAQYTMRVVTRMVPISFRGATTEMAKDVLAVAAQVPADRVDELVRALQGSGLETTTQLRAAPDASSDAA